jgi:hypothetical protein
MGDFEKSGSPFLRCSQGYELGAGGRIHTLIQQRQNVNWLAPTQSELCGSAPEKGVETRTGINIELEFDGNVIVPSGVEQDGRGLIPPGFYG